MDDLLGEGSLRSRSVTVTLLHDAAKTWGIQLDHTKVVKHLVAESGCDAKDTATLTACKDSDRWSAASAAIAEPSTRVEALIERLASFRDSRPILGALDLLTSRMPKFLYFSNYDRMLGAVALTDLAKRKAADTLTANNRVFVSFLEFAGTSIEDVVEL